MTKNLAGLLRGHKEDWYRSEKTTAVLFKAILSSRMLKQLRPGNECSSRFDRKRRLTEGDSHVENILVPREPVRRQRDFFE
jgi:hypothetical protein